MRKLHWRVEPIVPRHGGMIAFSGYATFEEIMRQADRWARQIGRRVPVKVWSEIG